MLKCLKLKIQVKNSWALEKRRMRENISRALQKKAPYTPMKEGVIHLFKELPA